MAGDMTCDVVERSSLPIMMARQIPPAEKSNHA
jgi:hypothetical protein